MANYGDIPMTGVLRSEVNDYLKQQLSKSIKNPEVEARSLIRLSVLGGVSKPGFYQLDSGMLLSDALQAAGGIGTRPICIIQSSSVEKKRSLPRKCSTK